MIIRLLAAALVIAIHPWTGAGQSVPGVHPISGRVYARPLSMEGAAWLDRAEREQEEAPERALSLLAIPRGTIVADVGAGSGYVTERLARLVGPSGRVYANDFQPGMIELLRRRLSVKGITNVTPVLGTADDPRLPQNAIDVVLMVDVYHELSTPQQMLRHLKRALKANGRLVLLEYRGEDAWIPIRPDHKMTVAQAKLELEHEGFQLVRVDSSLPWQHLLVFTPQSPSK